MSNIEPPPKRTRADAGRENGKLSNGRFRELCIKHGPRVLEIIAEIAERGEPDLVRLAAAWFLIERGFGLVDGENPGAVTQISVITGVRDRGPDEALPAARPLLPDGRDPFEQPAAPPSGLRPIGRAPVAEEPCVVLSDVVDIMMIAPIRRRQKNQGETSLSDIYLLDGARSL